MRVRGFTQDDAHIFCTPETVHAEIVGCIDFAFNIYEVFGFKEYQSRALGAEATTAVRYLRCRRGLGKCRSRAWSMP